MAVTEDSFYVEWDVPEQLGWDLLEFVFGPDIVAGARRDLHDRDRWESEGGALRD